MGKSGEQFWKEFLEEPSQERFSPLYERSHTIVYSIAIRILRDPDDALDAFQAVYCRLLAISQASSGAALPDGFDEHIRVLAVREARNLYERRMRRQRKEIAVERLPSAADPGLSADRVAASREMRDQIEILLVALPEKHRLPLVLHYFEGLSQRQIAKALGTSTSTVSYRIRRGLEKLRPIMRRAGLWDPATTLGAMIAAGAIVGRPSSLNAAAVFAKAKTTLAAGGGAP